MAGFVHAMLGFTGLMGLLLRFVGPLTIVPTMILIFIALVGPVLKFVEANWGIALSYVEKVELINVSCNSDMYNVYVALR